MPELNDPDPFAELQNVLNASVDAATRPTGLPPRPAPRPFIPQPGLAGVSIGAAAPPSSPPATVPARSDLEAFMTSGEKMLELQRSKISTARSRYELERARMVDDYRTRIEAIEHEGGESLRQLDIAHEKELGEAEHLIEVLTAMRDIKRR